MVQREMFTPPSGKDLRDHGMALVESNALAWGDDIRAASEFWFRNLEPGHRFTSEMLRHYLTEVRGLSEPHHHNAWSAVLGSLLRRWVKNRKIVNEGFITSNVPSSHARAIRIYSKL